MRSHSSPEFSRNYGFWSEDEQRALLTSSVALAGVGGDGFQLGVKLARMGVSRFSVADPEPFEPENANRVPGATTSTYGRPKVEVFREHVLDVNPDAEVQLFGDGVTLDNAEEFLRGAQLVFDESELTQPEIGVTIARRARAMGIPNVLVMNVGFAAQVTSFHPSGRYTFERFMGASEQASLEEIATTPVDFSRFLPYIPPYSDLRSLITLQSPAPDGSTASLPSISAGVDLASAIGSTQAFLHLTAAVSNRRQKPIWAPRIAYVDAYRMRARTIRASRGSHIRSLLVAAARDRLGRNPRASYTHDDIRARREA
jgi:molybdopterin/thiamine biosynthesis adenylyltransferase